MEWNNASLSDVTKVEISVHNTKRHVWHITKRAVRHGGSSIRLWNCFSSVETETLIREELQIPVRIKNVR